jgi:transposase InsO family protein
MNIHENARTTPASRALLVRRIADEQWTVSDAASAAGVSRRTAYKWLQRQREKGPASLRDRPSRAHHLRHALPEEWTQIILYLRQFRQPARVIAGELAIARSTVSAVLARHGVGAQRALEPVRPVCRYERRRPGDLLHVDIKRLARFWRPGHRVTGSREGQSCGAGYEYIHVAVDDHSRIAYAEIHPDERSATCMAFLRHACAWFAAQGIAIRRVLTDNGTGYRGHIFRQGCLAMQLRHLRTKPRTPQTNGKAERFIQSMLREWAYGRVWPDSRARAAQLIHWLTFYNQSRPHASLGYQPPFSRRPLGCEQRS